MENPVRNNITNRGIQEVRPKVNKSHPDCYIKQNNAMNSLAAAISKKDVKKDTMAGLVFLEHGKFKYSLIGLENTDLAIKNSAIQLLDILSVLMIESGNARTIITSTKGIMNFKGLKDSKEAAKTIKRDLDILTAIVIHGEEKLKGKKFNYNAMHIISNYAYSHAGMINVCFDEYFLKVFNQSYLSYFPQELFKVDNHRFRYAYSIGRKIAMHKHINIGKPNENIISVKTLLDESGLPSYENVMQNKHKQVDIYIIRPFENNLEHLKELGILSWEYCHSSKQPLTQDELDNFNYNVFIGLKIKLTWYYYPDQKKLTESRKKNRQKAKKATERAMQKALEKKAEKKLKEIETPIKRKDSVAAAGTVSQQPAAIEIIP